MAQVKVGSRLKSAVCATEVMVVGAPDADVDITCGGARDGRSRRRRSRGRDDRSRSRRLGPSSASAM